ncbi:MAG: MBL fold metallo-hydrolase [Bacteroidota bacterium]
MIHIDTFVFNSFSVNTYILSDETNECMIVDAGCNSEKENSFLKNYIRTNSLTPVRLINTHCHIDHILGNNFVFNEFQISPEAHKDEEIILSGARQHALMFGIQLQEPPNISNFLTEKDIIKFGNSSLDILHVPGHSKGSLAFLSKTDGFVLAGDVLFSGSIGRTDLIGGNYQLLIQSIKEKLFVLDENTRVYPGHGEFTTIGKEIRSNPFFLD